MSEVNEELSQDEQKQTSQPEPTDEHVDETTGSSEPQTEGEESTEDVAAAEVNQLQQQLLRVHADFDNFRKRTRQEKEDLQKFAAKRVLEDLLPVLDNFERAAAALTDAADDVRQGIEMVQRQLAGVLEQHGVKAMNPVGQPFDPRLHEAVMQEPADGEEAGTVLAVLQQGYMLHDKVLRPAMVKVAQ